MLDGWSGKVSLMHTGGGERGGGGGAPHVPPQKTLKIVTQKCNKTRK
jgi:hypothetical protein